MKIQEIKEHLLKTKPKHWTDKIPMWLLVIIMAMSFIGCVIMSYIITVILIILGFGKLFEG